MKFIKEVVLCVILVLVLETRQYTPELILPPVTPIVQMLQTYTPRPPGENVIIKHLSHKHRAYTGLGCYKDFMLNRMFRGSMSYLNRKCSNRNCVDFCKRRRFVYAGTQAG